MKPLELHYLMIQILKRALYRHQVLVLFFLTNFYGYVELKDIRVKISENMYKAFYK